MSLEPTIALGKTGLRVSRVGLGAMTWGEPVRWNPAQGAYGPSAGIDEEREALRISLEAGVDLVDTAAMYSRGGSERRVGELAKDKPVFVATKFPKGFVATAGAIPRTLEGSLARLNRTSIDLYQIHWPSLWLSIPKAMSHLADAVEAGKVKAVGVSNFSAAEMRAAHEALAARGIPLATNQVQYSLLYRKPEVDGVLDACRELGVTLIAFMPLASGALTGKFSKQNPPTGLRRYFGFFRGEKLARLEAVVALLSEIGGRYGKTPGQVALRWLIEQDVIPIPGAKNAHQARQNAGVLDFGLTADEVAALEVETRPWRT